MAKPKPNLKKKPLNKEEEDAQIKQQIRQRLIAAKEAIIAEITAKLAIQKRVTVGVGNEEEFYDELINGFKKTLSARGIEIPRELEEKIKENGGRIVDKENGPVVVNLTKKYGIVPKQD